MIQNFINGSFVEHKGDFIVKHNPSTEDVLYNVPKSGLGEVCNAVETARKALRSWRSLSRVKRGDLFEKLVEVMRRDEELLVVTNSIETGKSRNESRAEFVEALHMAQYTFGRGRMPCGEMVASEIADKDCYVIRKPKGVVAIISPWNFPLAIGGFWCAAPALLEGNTVVWKPSEETPYTAHLVAAIYKEAGFPDGVINVVHGDGSTGQALAMHHDVNHICFTGSREVGAQIQKVCAGTSKSCSCEMGSKSAVIVFDDADLDLAVSAAVASAYKLSGQRCVSSGRMIVERHILGAFYQKFVDLSKRLRVGDPFQGDNYYGPLINKSQYERVIQYNEMALSDQDVATSLHYEKLSRKGYYLTPHVYMAEWDRKKRFLHEEVFGPHVALIPFNGVDEAVHIYNDTEYGLALGVCTSDFKKAREVRERCDFGMGYWNGGSIAAESHLPFGGLKASGYGGSSAAGTFDTVVHKVTWTVNHGELQFPQGLK